MTMLIHRLLFPICFAILCHSQTNTFAIVRPDWDHVQEPTGLWNVPLLVWKDIQFPVYPSPAGANTIILHSRPDFAFDSFTNVVVQSSFTPKEVVDGLASDRFFGVEGDDVASFDRGQHNQQFPLHNVLLVNASYSTLPDSRHFNISVGNLRLGSNYTINREAEYDDLGPTGVLFLGNKTASPSYALNLGSTQLRLPGSLTFGGYDQNRAIGDAGMFDTVLWEGRMSLRDIVLGVHEGLSPFPKDLNITSTASMSVWQGGSSLVNHGGAPYGPSELSINAEYPGFLLSRENCEAMSKHLPVTWQSDIGFYTWNTADIRYKQITSSPAYVGFVLSDREAKNITVKVPFAYLTNTLDKPVVSKQTPYFPCQPGIYPSVVLGRAFMQSAFIATNYDTNITYVAQGPGPNVDQTIVKAFPTDGSALSTNPADSFSKTWSGFWTPIPDPAEKQSSSNTLSAAQVAGIVVGVVLAVVTAVLGAWYIWYQRKKKRAALAAATESENSSALQEADSTSIDKKDEKNEVDAEDTAVHELAGPNIQQEMGGEAIAELEA